MFTILRFSLLYFVARALPGLVNFAALLVYSRLLSPAEFGHYTLVVTGVGFGNSFLYWWLKLSLVRFAPEFATDQSPLLSTILINYLAIGIATSIPGLVLAYLVDDDIARALIITGLLLLWVQAWFDINLELIRIRAAPVSYGWLVFSRSVLALILATILAFLGAGGVGVVVGVLLGTGLSLLIFTRRNWPDLRLTSFNIPLGKSLLGYGWPLSLTFALSFVITSSDRALLAYLLGTNAAGQYAVGYDIANQSLGLLFNVIYLASYPLILHSLNDKNSLRLHQNLQSNLTMILAIGLPSTIGFVLIAPELIDLALGQAFRTSSLELVPWISAASILAALKAYHFDLAFQIAKRTTLQLYTTGLTAAVNIILNLLWIPKFGLIGAAYSTVVAYVLGVSLSAAAGRTLLPIPLWNKDTTKITFATIIMAIVVDRLVMTDPVIELACKILLGASLYSLLFVIFNIIDSRSLFRHFGARIR